MSETKPEKRLVSKGRYVRVMVKKLGKYALATLLAVLGASICFCLLLVMLRFDFRTGMDWILLGGGLLVLWVPYFLFWYAKELFNEAEIIQPVQPITDQNVHLLPVQETLLRGADLPSTIQQAELLRATQAEQETAKEELLRAITGKE